MNVSVTQAPPREALDAALDRVGAAPALRAYLDKVLRGVEMSCWPTIAWRTSRLTADGFPVELSFTNADPNVRFTAEVAGPEAADDTRLTTALELLSSVGAAADREIAARLGTVQAGAELRWGAWFGGRVDEYGDQVAKLYVEVPRAGNSEAERWVRELLDRWPLEELGRDVPLRMIGWEPSSQRIEFYFRPGTLDDVAIARLLDVVAQGDRADELLTVLRDAWQRPLSPELPSANLGCSVSVPTRGGGAKVVSVIAFARSVFGPDANARTSILRLADRQGWKLDSYAAASEPLATRASPVPWHGMVSFVLAPRRDIVFGVGIRPPHR